MTRKEQYTTLLILCAGFMLIGWKAHSCYIAASAGVVLLLGLLSQILLQKITAAWMWIGEKIGAVMSRVILTVVFVFCLTPLALLFRLFRKRNTKKPDSYFVTREHTYEAADLEKAF